MTLFGWCLTGHHDECRGTYRPLWIEGKARVRYRDEERACSCACHDTKENS